MCQKNKDRIIMEETSILPILRMNCLLLQLNLGNEQNETCTSPTQIEVDACHMEIVDEANSEQLTKDVHNSNKKKRRTRGRISLKAVAPRNGEKHACFLLEDGRVVGEGRRKLSIFLGILAHNPYLFPIHKEWGEEHESMIDRVMVDVLTAINQKIRDFRKQLKRKLLPHIPIGQQLETLDDRVPQEHWKLLIQLWSDEKKMMESSRNKRNRKALQATHTPGPISFAEKQYKIVEGGQYVPLLENYLNAHKKKNGEYPNEKTKECCMKVAEQTIEMGMEKTKNPLEFISVLDNAFGAHHGGYVREISGGITRRHLKRKIQLNKLNGIASKNLQSQLHEKDQQLEDREHELEDLCAQLKLYQSKEQDGIISLEQGHRLAHLGEVGVPSTSCSIRRISTQYGTLGHRTSALCPHPL